MRSGAEVCKSCRSRQELSFIPTSIHLQRFVSIQPRTSLSKFANNSPKVRKSWKHHRRAPSAVQQAPRAHPRANPRAYDGSNFLSNCWRFFGKLWEARSRLCRSRILQVNTKYSFETLNSYLVRNTRLKALESWRDLQDLHAFAPFSIQNFSQISSNFFAFS